LEQDLPQWFGKNILPIDQEVAERGDILLQQQNQIITFMQLMLF
jgi:hypothetical protein